MSQREKQVDPRRGERGNVMVMTALLALGLVLAVGLSIDVARIYALRTELQNAADAAALAAARELDSGTSGIQNAVTRATTIVNNYGFGRAAITIVTVQFSDSLNGTYVDSATAQNNPATIRFVRVTTQSTATTMLFAVNALGNNHTESKSATAGMSPGLNTICDFFPVAVALDNLNPAPNTTMTLNFVQGTNNAATLNNGDYIVLEVPDINGNGSVETAVLSAGLTNICQTLSTNVQFHMTPSSNVNNGPRQITDGVNTRFNIYANGYGNQLQPSTYPPDSNIQEAITFTQYDNKTAVTAPNPNGPGKDFRRVLLVPLIAPGSYSGSPVSAPTLGFGAFFLKSRSVVDSPCSNALTGCAHLDVEWVDESLVIGRGGFDPSGGCTTFTLPVLYK